MTAVLTRITANSTVAVLGYGRGQPPKTCPVLADRTFARSTIGYQSNS